MTRPVAQLAACLLLTLAASPAAAEMTLTSPSLDSNGAFVADQVLNGFGCTGGNLSPALEWSGAPEGTASFALMMHDPDAPTGSGWWHWTVFNLPASTTGLPEGASASAMPEGSIESRTDFGAPGYGGACPPEDGGAHAYAITLYALPLTLGLDAEVMPAMLSYMLRGSALDSVTLTVPFGR